MMQQVINVLTANVTIKSHPTDNAKIILDVNGTEYPLDGNDVLIATNNSMNI